MSVRYYVRSSPHNDGWVIVQDAGDGEPMVVGWRHSKVGADILRRECERIGRALEW